MKPIRSTDPPPHVRDEVRRWMRGKSSPEAKPVLGTGETITLILLLPAKCLSPNARVHPFVLAKAKRIHRDRARWATYDAIAGKTPRWLAATIQATFYHPQRRVRDQMNLIGSLKAYEDGIVDAGLLADDEGVTWLPAIRCIDRDNPRLVLTITRQEIKP
jgi:Holliday junction resolvase RusA-like endonuclease